LLLRYFVLSLTANLLFRLISRSWSITQWMPLSRIALLSWICCELKLPFLRKISFMHKNAMPIAIINVVNSSILIIND